MDPFAHRNWYPYTSSAITAQSWDASTESHIPFRARTNHAHHTWAKTFYAYPELYIQPETEKELQLVINLARHQHKKVLVVGSGHSPSTLTCTNGWMVNLDRMNKVIHVDDLNKRVVVEAGIRLYQLQKALDEMGMAIPNLGSIMEQSIAGAISTSTHGSSLQHGLLSDNVLGLRILLSNGHFVECSELTNPELFAAALVSLGGLGIITQVSYQAVPAFKLAWRQEVMLFSKVAKQWESLWVSSEFARVWWFPYSERAIYWQAKRTDEPLKARPVSWYGGWLNRNLYELALYISAWFPSLTPFVERTVFRMQYGWEEGTTGTAVEKSWEALTMDCLFSQHVNEWSIPLENGPEALTRFQAWLMGDEATAKIPFSSKGIYVHAPIEVRVSDTTHTSSPRPLLDQSIQTGPSLYLNATLYRPFLTDFPGKDHYYEAFEWLMKELGGKPHWAKNWITVDKEDLFKMYPDLGRWVAIRKSVDSIGMFASEWLETTLLPEEEEGLLSEKEEERTDEEGPSGSDNDFFNSMGSSTESFDMMRASEAHIFTPMSGSVESLLTPP